MDSIPRERLFSRAYVVAYGGHATAQKSVGRMLRGEQ